jgi:RNA polymerase sigma-70 factor (ECF subfamily)
MPTGQTDNEIISQVLRGNQAAYADLVNKYQGYVFTLTLRLVKSREDAEELAQDVFIKAYRYLADFRGDSKFSTWLYTIVNNTCITWLRKKKLDTRSLDDEQVFARADNMDSGARADSIEQKSRQQMVTRAIAQLGADDAMVLTLFYQAEQSLEEAARILGIEVNAAKVRLHRARGRLKEKLERNFATELKDLN